jgi:hypothetical protein
MEPSIPNSSLDNTKADSEETKQVSVSSDAQENSQAYGANRKPMQTQATTGPPSQQKGKPAGGAMGGKSLQEMFSKI